MKILLQMKVHYKKTTQEKQDLKATMFVTLLNFVFLMCDWKSFTSHMQLRVKYCKSYESLWRIHADQ